MITLTELIKDRTVFFDSYRAGFFYYIVAVTDNIDPGGSIPTYYQFTVPIEDVGNATLFAKDKAVVFMRWIRKAFNNNELIKVDGKQKENIEILERRS